MELKGRTERLREALGVSRPSVLTQGFYDAEPATLQRVFEGRAVGRDWDQYVEAAFYGDPFQPELFAYVLPELLAKWESSILDTALGEHVPDLLARRLPLLGPNAVAATAEYLADAVLGAFDALVSLSAPNRVAAMPAYRWQAILSTAGTIPGAVSHLLPNWLALDTSGRAVALVQFASCLLYHSDFNPLFHRWTPEDGGGPPTLWETAGFGATLGWNAHNVVALGVGLPPARLIEILEIAPGRVPLADQVLAQRVVDELPLTQFRLELRWSVLLHLLEEPDSALAEDWNG